MNARDRAWRKKLVRMVKLLDEEIEKITSIDDLLRGNRLSVLRERLAGALGAEEGRCSTPELRRRAARDFVEAVERLGVADSTFEPPPGHRGDWLIERDLASFRRSWPKMGDRC